MESLYVLVITMWGYNGAQWEYIGNQITLQQPMSEAQCVYLIDEGMWASTYTNEYYKMDVHCFDVNCAGKKDCE